MYSHTYKATQQQASNGTKIKHQTTVKSHKTTSNMGQKQQKCETITKIVSDTVVRLVKFYAM